MQRRYAYHVRKPLDITAMNKASQFLIGLHDFASFGKPPQGENTVRHITGAEWSANDNLLTFEITANAFLYHMVRTIVGTLVHVGLGQMAINEINTILKARDLTRSVPAAPAHGLCLVQVTYPDEG
jgi:tRNA pseudouridine38-40 synthase